MTLEENIRQIVQSNFSESKEEIQEIAIKNILKLLNPTSSNKTNWKLEIDFKADNDWEPLASACWCDCPLSSLIKLGHACFAKEMYDKNNIIICPIVRYKAHKEKPSIDVPF